MTNPNDPLGALATLETSSGPVSYYRLDRLTELGLTDIGRLPFSVRVLLENLLRRLDGHIVTEEDVHALASWAPGSLSPRELPFLPARVLLQDLTGIPVVADLAALRSEVDRLGADPQRVNPLFPVDLVVDPATEVSATPTETGTPAGETATPTVPAETPTPTPTPTETGAETPTPTPTPTETGVETPTPTPTPTETPAATPTATETPAGETATPTVPVETPTPTPTPTETGAETPTPTPTATPTEVATPTTTPTATAALGATASPSVSATSAPTAVLRVVSSPQQTPAALPALLPPTGGADTKAFVMMLFVAGGVLLCAGWVTLKAASRR